jgi:hypothetical protein
MRMLSIAVAAALGLAFLGHPAYAAQLPDGSIAWSFEGHGVGIPSGSEYAVDGEMIFSGVHLHIDASVGGAAHGLTGDIQPVLFEDGNLNSADRMSSAQSASAFVSAPGLLAPFSPYAGSGLLSLNFFDTDGTVFNGLVEVAAGSLGPPVDAPDASLFEVRKIDLFQNICSDIHDVSGDSLCADGGGQRGITPVFTLTVDAFHEPLPTPEASSAASLTVALSALFAARRLGVHSGA